jgi:hypothetical protein
MRSIEHPFASAKQEGQFASRSRSKRAKQSTNISSNGPAGAVHTCFQEGVGQVI